MHMAPTTMKAMRKSVRSRAGVPRTTCETLRMAAASATPNTIEICWNMLDSVEAEPRFSPSTSAKASVARAVNCIERVSPATNSTAKVSG